MLLTGAISNACMNSVKTTRRLFWIFLLLFILTSLALYRIGIELENPVSPSGIVSFEFCGFHDRCRAMINAWGETGKQHALLLLGLDYLYLFLYPGVLAFALLLLQTKMPVKRQKVNRCAIWVCPFIAAADAIENYGSIQMILYEKFAVFDVLSGVFAVIKFALLGLVFLWLLYALAIHFLNPRQRA